MKKNQIQMIYNVCIIVHDDILNKTLKTFV